MSRGKKTAKGSTGSGETTGAGWLEPLEQRVRQAAERLRELADDNRRLRERLDELAAELEAARTAAAEAADGGGDEPAAGDAAGWRREREAVRRRVEGLATRLGELLEGDG